MMTRDPQLTPRRSAAAATGRSRGWRNAACRARLEMATWMIDHGSDVHQGGDGPLMRAALDDDRIPMMALLVGRGADVNARWNGQTEWRRERLRCCGKISGRRA